MQDFMGLEYTYFQQTRTGGCAYHLNRAPMPGKVSPKEFIHLLNALQHRQEAQRVAVDGVSLDPQLAMLRQWQTERLTNTYSDLLADEEYRSACLFFLSDLYAPRDFSQRNHDAEYIYNLLSRFLPEDMLALLADAIRINQLTSQLDHTLLKVLVDDLGATETITPQLYARAYRLCDNYAERKEQITLLTRTLQEAAEGARNPLFAVSLRLVRGPAQRAGWFELYDFLERGYLACKPMQNVDAFVGTIQRREMEILDKIFADDEETFVQQENNTPTIDDSINS
jgi:hypothetical protein